MSESWVLVEGAVGSGARGVPGTGTARYSTLHRDSCRLLDKVPEDRKFPMGTMSAAEAFNTLSGFEQACKRCIPEWEDPEWTAANTWPKKRRRQGATDHRRCESCGQVMRPRMHRVTDTTGRKVCDNCARNDLGSKEWNVPYASQHTAVQGRCDLCGVTRELARDVHNQRVCVECQKRLLAKTEMARREAEAMESVARVLRRQAAEGDTISVAPRGRPAEGFRWSVSDADGTVVAFGMSLTEEQATRQAETVKSLRTGSLQTVAHDSGDGETIYHCPFCGSGQVTGGADGTVTCDFCHSAFTVQVQPKFKSMPQTIDGQPYNIPGMPGGGPDAGDSRGAEADDQGQAQDDAPKPGDSPSEDAHAGESPAADAAKKPNPFAKGSAYVAVEGGVLPVDKALQHLALKYADDKQAVLAQVRAENAG